MKKKHKKVAYDDAKVDPEEVERDRLDEELSDQGITPHYLVAKLKKELNAKRTEFAKYQGEIVTKEDCIAWDIRQKARMDAHKLMGHYKNEFGEGVNIGDIEITFVEADHKEDGPTS